MAGRHPQCSDHELGQTPACCGPWVARSRTRLGDRTAMVISHAAAVRNPKSACVASPEHPPRSRCDSPHKDPSCCLYSHTHSPPAPEHRLLSPGDLQPALYFCNSAASTALYQLSHVVHAFGDELSTRHPAGLSREPSGAGVCQQSFPLYGGVVLRDTDSTCVSLAIHLWKNI